METVEETQNQLEKSPKRIKFEEIVEEGGEDRISGLPDFLILEILSRLPFTEDAIQTGILSKRWKHLWTSIPTLIFDYNDSNRSVSNFISFVDKTLAQCRQLKLKKFEVYVSNDVQFKAKVNSWIRYALNCNVEELKVELCRRMFEVGFVSDQSIFTASCFAHLSLQGCQFNPSGAITWKNLRSLCVKGRKLDKDLIENILSGSPVLETLVLKFCYGYRRLDITSKSLKKLVLFGYLNPKYLCSDDASDAGIIEINAPHILSLTIKDGLWLRKLLLVNVSSLVEAYLDFCKYGIEETTLEEILKGLIVNLRHVKVLKIGSSCFKALSGLQAEGFSIPSNVKCTP